MAIYTKQGGQVRQNEKNNMGAKVDRPNLLERFNPGFELSLRSFRFFTHCCAFNFLSFSIFSYHELMPFFPINVKRTHHKWNYLSGNTDNVCLPKTLSLILCCCLESRISLLLLPNWCLLVLLAFQRQPLLARSMSCYLR